MQQPSSIKLHSLSRAGLSPQRLQWIAKAAQNLRKDHPSPLGAAMDCVWLLGQMEQLGRYPHVRLRTTAGLNQIKGVEALSIYAPDENRHLILMEESCLVHPFITPAQRRANFTLAHELGHILLGHTALPDQARSPALRLAQDEEADEFAGCLLMPQHLLLQCQIRDVAQAAAFWQVSQAALWQRLNNLGRLDLLRTPQRLRPSCPVCGNMRHNLWQSLYCAVCASPVRQGSFAVLPMLYRNSAQGNACTQCWRALPGFARHCDGCGALSRFYQSGKLLPWQLEIGSPLGEGSNSPDKAIGDN